MGRPKPLVPLAGRPLLEHVLSSVRRSRVGHIVVVLGLEADRIRREVDLDGAKIVVNEDYALGMSSSIRAGLRVAHPNSKAFLVVLGDQPLVSPSTLDSLIDRWSGSAAKICIPTYRGARGNPVLVDRSLSKAMEAISGDLGCRAIFHDYPDEILEIPVDRKSVV